MALTYFHEYQKVTEEVWTVVVRGELLDSLRLLSEVPDAQGFFVVSFLLHINKQIHGKYIYDMRSIKHSHEYVTSGV